MIALSLAMAASAGTLSAKDRKAFEPYRQCVLLAARYEYPGKSAAEIAAIAEDSCGNNMPFGFLDRKKHTIEMRHISDRLRLPADVQTALTVELTGEVAKQILETRSQTRNNAQHQ